MENDPLKRLAETFAVNRLGFPAGLRRWLCTTNLIELPHAGARLRTRRVTNWQNGSMVLRWAALALLTGEELPADHGL
ncbi:MAG TPA: hypothetical protein PKG54_18470 [Phycisphaerae bacterium]|nr:hypothetical protein [Phycisphaerae bacterium]HOB76498.1 hypothetical protein [Phycisphaerae bacterium]HOJ53703.1 hypothetical protein [Phycisphaerae bacterium]HOL27978.1 hypothetical protein [Phycisphaerae bacterium]HPP22375.1 hypothetical protein [Phycisphaerae bacterium]